MGDFPCETDVISHHIPKSGRLQDGGGAKECFAAMPE